MINESTASGVDSLFVQKAYMLFHVSPRHDFVFKGLDSCPSPYSAAYQYQLLPVKELFERSTCSSARALMQFFMICAMLISLCTPKYFVVLFIQLWAGKASVFFEPFGRIDLRRRNDDYDGYVKMSATWKRRKAHHMSTLLVGERRTKKFVEI